MNPREIPKIQATCVQALSKPPAAKGHGHTKWLPPRGCLQSHPQSRCPAWTAVCMQHLTRWGGHLLFPLQSMLRQSLTGMSCHIVETNYVTLAEVWRLMFARFKTQKALRKSRPNKRKGAYPVSVERLPPGYNLKTPFTQIQAPIPSPS